MTTKFHSERHQAMSAGRESSPGCNIVHFPTPREGRGSPLFRYTIPPASAFLFRSLAAKRPHCAAL